MINYLKLIGLAILTSVIIMLLPWDDIYKFACYLLLAAAVVYIFSRTWWLGPVINGLAMLTLLVIGFGWKPFALLQAGDSYGWTPWAICFIAIIIGFLGTGLGHLGLKILRERSAMSRWQSYMIGFGILCVLSILMFLNLYEFLSRVNNVALEINGQATTNAVLTLRESTGSYYLFGDLDKSDYPIVIDQKNKRIGFTNYDGWVFGGNYFWRKTQNYFLPITERSKCNPENKYLFSKDCIKIFYVNSEGMSYDILVKFN